MSSVRLLRGVMLLLVAAVLSSVAWTLRRGVPVASPAGEPSPLASDPPGAPGKPPTRMGDVVYRNVKGGRESFVLRAKRMSGSEQEQLQLEEVAAEFSYVAHAAPGKGRIVSDHCVYFPARQEALFEGHVRLETDDGLQLETEQLVYGGQDGGARSDRPVVFARRLLAGSAQKMSYEARGSRLQLEGDVVVRGRDEGAFEIRSARASLEREEGEARFEEGVVLTRPGDVLRSDTLTLQGSEQQIERARAAGNVEVRSTGETLPVTPQAPAGQARKGGPRELRSQQLDVKLRPDHSLEEAVASGDAVLVVLPGPGEASERRTLKGAVLAFRWDEQERLTEVQGQKDAEFVGEPLPPAKGPARRIKSRNFVATLDPESGTAKSAEFNKDVRFERGNLEARAERASYDGAEAQLSLNEEPSLVDEEQGSRLQAETIEIFTRTGDIRARHSVRHTLERRGERAATIPGSESDTSVVSARLFDYEAKSRTARYRDGALLRSGRSELRAAEIRRVDASPDHRRLEAFGDVATLLYPRPKPGEAGQPPVDGRAQQMSYDEAKRELVYKGDVALVQGELRTKSPEAILLLGRETGELDRLEAFDPVELRQGTRIATGQRAVYTPADKTIVVTGDKAELKDEKQQAQGRTLTFFVGEDRILVDGREEGRTETILRRQP